MRLWARNLPRKPKTKYLRNQGRLKSHRQLVEDPSSFITGRPKAALLFCFFGDFRYDVPLLIVILVIYKYQNRLK